ncbi:MAG: hypothetical protein DMF67_20740 [Acidobacteria bacterium]|nr:MAG: hypothetical protein DMF67_20740 [Acidobacteriota bacterium]
MRQRKAGAKQQGAPRAVQGQKRAARSCGLCGKSEKLTRTECCGEWICDDESEYVLFSYAHNSCHRNHSRYTLRSSHYNEGHEGMWQECQQCREGFETEMYVWYGINEYNFVKLANPPAYKPTKCAKCKRVIRLAEDGYSMKGGKYYCDRCTGFDLSRLLG